MTPGAGISDKIGRDPGFRLERLKNDPGKRDL